MKIFVQVKSVGKRKPVFEAKPYEIGTPGTLRELLLEICRMETEAFNQKSPDRQLLPFLTQEEIDDRAVNGKVGFGNIYNEKKADVSRAQENVILAFEDGLIRVFAGECELEKLDEPLDLKEGDVLTFIRLTFLAGRMW